MLKQKTLGIVGGGQLGRMLAEAAGPLGIKTIVLDPTPHSPAGQVADKQIVGDFTDAKQIKKLAAETDYITFEIESVNAEVLQDLKKKGSKVNPSPTQLKIIQDKYLQKKLFQKNNIATAPFMAVKTANDIAGAAKKFGYPLLLKARHQAYDGRGNAIIKKQSDISRALEKLHHRELYVEKFVPFVKEIATQAARTTNGTIYLFPLVETIQKNNICHIVKAPAEIKKSVARSAVQLATKVAKIMKGAGVFGIELFLTRDEKVIVNEIAPRVHNSGHHTIESCSVSQFEQHVRLVTGLKQKKIIHRTPAVMISILGNRSGKAMPKNITKAANENGVFIHLYGKKETKPERKMGHITALASTPKKALQKARRAHTLIHI